MSWTTEHELGYCAALCGAKRGRYVGPDIASYLDCQAVNGPKAFKEAARLVRALDYENAGMTLLLASQHGNEFQAGIDEYFRQENE